MNRAFEAVIDSPLGMLGIKLIDDRLAELHFLASDASEFSSDSLAVKKIITELGNYFTDAKHVFDVPYVLSGTALQRKIWQVISKIPVGTTISYGEVAKKLGTGPRVIGNACRSNPIPIVIPCHRIVASNGDLCGYCGFTKGLSLNNKKWLLEHEKS